MEKTQSVTLYIGHGTDSQEAVKIVEAAGVTLRLVDCTHGHCDFDPPLLISPWGVFDSLNSIIWFGKVAAGVSVADDS